MRFYFCRLRILWWCLLAVLLIWFSVPRFYIAIYNKPFKTHRSPDEHYRLEYYDTLFTPPFSRYGFNVRWKSPMTECCRPGYVQLVRNIDNKKMGGVFYSNFGDYTSIRWHVDTVSIVGFYRWEDLL